MGGDEEGVEEGGLVGAGGGAWRGRMWMVCCAVRAAAEGKVRFVRSPAREEEGPAPEWSLDQRWPVESGDKRCRGWRRACLVGWAHVGAGERPVFGPEGERTRRRGKGGAHGLDGGCGRRREGRRDEEGGGGRGADGG